MKDVTRVAVVEPDKCISCGLCERVCPVLAVHVGETKGVPGAGYDEGLVSPCQQACPAGINVEGYVALAAEGKVDEAYQLILQSIPFPAVCGRICPHPCETECNRGSVDKAIAIRDIKRYIADEAFKNGEPAQVKPLSKKGKSVGIIGAGPSGLTCGYYLALLGYDVEVYEEQPVAGGVLAYGIPEYRLPKKVLQKEVKRIENAGVVIHLNTTVGKDITFDALQAKHGALYVATGTQFSKELGVPGEDLEGVCHGLDFLQGVNLKTIAKVGPKVVVVGGGNTAIDVARSAVRLGAKDVTILYRREQKDMPAERQEILDAIDEGVKVIPLAAPVRFNGKGKLESIECTRMELQEIDESGRGRPVAVEHSEFTIEADMAILAVSQFADLPFISRENVQISPKGEFVTDDTKMTSIKGVFAGGDLVRGSDYAITAIADGKTAAQSIDKYLGGQGILNVGEAIKIPGQNDRKNLYELERFPLEYLEREKRKTSFEEAVRGYSKANAEAEATRCLRCSRQLKAVVESDKCQGCTICSTRCPVGAIEMKEREVPFRVGIEVKEITPEIEAICTKAHMYPDQVICYCHRVQAKEVAAAILAGARTPEEASQMTGVRTGCGVLCITTVLRLMIAGGMDPATRPPGNQWYGQGISIWTLPEETMKRFDKDYYLLRDREEMDKIFPGGKK